MPMMISGEGDMSASRDRRDLAHSTVAVNTRVLAFAMGGQQRVAKEIMARLAKAEGVAPSRPLTGMAGHAWEQFVLPTRLRGRLLWSPSATGPLAVRHQVLTIHDTASFDMPEMFASGFRRAYAALLPRLARRVAAIVTVSEFSRGRIIEVLGAPPERVTVIPNGVSSCFHPRSRDEVAAVRQRYGLGGRYLLVQATSDRRKNLARVVEAWSGLRGTIPDDVELVVVGHTGRAHVFGEQGKIADAPAMRRLGFVPDDDLAALLTDATAFLFPSLYEGFGIPVIEAMATGTPVITSNVSALPEVVGDAGLCIDPSSTEKITRAIASIFANQHDIEALKKKGYVRAANFTWENAARKYENLFRACE